MTRIVGTKRKEEDLIKSFQKTTMFIYIVFQAIKSLSLKQHLCIFICDGELNLITKVESRQK